MRKSGNTRRLIFVFGILALAIFIFFGVYFGVRGKITGNAILNLEEYTGCPTPIEVYNNSLAAFNPRMIELNNGDILIAFLGIVPYQADLFVYQSVNGGENWSYHSLLENLSWNKSYFSPYFLTTDSGNITLAAYEKCSEGICNIKTADYYLDGNDWIYLGEIQKGGFDWGDGVYEPYFFKKDNDTIQVYYADETATKLGGNVKGQNIMMEEKRLTGGIPEGDWTDDPVTVVKGDVLGEEYGYRYGVPAVTRMDNGDLIVVYESNFWNNYTDIGLAYSISEDNGTTWSEKKALFNPPEAGYKIPNSNVTVVTPDIVKLNDGTLVVTFTRSDSETFDLENSESRFIYSIDNAQTWNTNSGEGYLFFDKYSLYGSIIQLRNGKIIVAKGGQTDWVSTADNKIYVKVYNNEEQFFECSGACVSSLINTSYSSWSNVSSCRVNNTVLQRRSLTQYDSNNCGEIENETFYDYKVISCVYSNSSSGSSSGGSSGGGGGSSSGNSYSVAEENLKQGYSAKLYKGNKVTFSFGSQNHSVSVNSIGTNSANISVASNPQTKVLSFGESWEVDLDEDSSKDIKVTLNNITSYTNVGLSIIELSNKKPTMEVNSNFENKSIDSNLSSGNSSTIKEDNGLVNKIIIILVVIFVIVLIITLVFLFWR